MITPRSIDLTRSENDVLPRSMVRWLSEGTGFADIDPDSDGVYRRFRPAIIPRLTSETPHFGVVIACAATGAKAGVTIRPWAVRRTPALADEPGSVAVTVKTLLMG